MTEKLGQAGRPNPDRDGTHADADSAPLRVSDAKLAAKAAEADVADLDATLEKLLRIGHDRDQLKGYLAKLSEVGADRDPIVTHRLREEYEKRLQAVRKEADPLIDSIRNHCAKVSQNKDRFSRQLEGARLNKAERELRREVGELGGKELERQIAQADAEIAEAEEGIRKIADVVHLLQQGLEDYQQGEPEEPQIEATVDESKPTLVKSVEPAPQTPTATPERPKTGETPKTATTPDATVIAPKAWIRGADGNMEYPVGRFALIGGEECHVALDGCADPEAHASIRFTESGFELRTEGRSQELRVNGDAVTSQILQHEDRLTIAGIDLVFHCR